MHPLLSYLVSSHDVIVDDIKNLSIIKIFDFLVIPRDKVSLFYSFYVAGRIHPNSTGVRNLSMEIRLVDPSGVTLVSMPLVAKEVKLDYSLSFYAKFELVEFKQEGRHLIRFYLDGQEVPSNTFIDIRKDNSNGSTQ